MIAIGVDLAWVGNDGCKRGKDRNGSKEKWVLGGGVLLRYTKLLRALLMFMPSRRSLKAG
jgi:hypothetical protein